MANRQVRRMGLILAAGLAAVLLVGGWGHEPAQAAGLDEINTSLKWIPEDAAFYSVMLRNREQIDIARKSKAWASILAMPAVKQGLAEFEKQVKSGDASQVKAFLENPETQKGLQLLADMFGEEVFVYGDKDFIGVLDLLQQVTSATRYGPLVALATEGTGADPAKAQGGMLLRTLVNNVDLVKIPNVIVGFRVKDKEAAKTALAKLEGMLNLLSLAAPQVSERLKSTKIDGQQYLVLSLDGKMIPWDSIPTDDLKKFEAKEGDADKLIAKLKESTLAIALGMRDDFVLFAIGSSTDCLARLGKGKHLTDLPEMKRLEKFADRRLVSISYLSRAMAERVMSNAREIEGLLKTVDQILPKADLSDQQKAEIRKDAAALAEDIERVMPKPGAILSFDFLTDRGIEGYTYNWGEHRAIDASKPITLLAHLGGNPMFGAAGRAKVSMADYDLMVKWVKVGYHYFQEYAVPEMKPEDREKYEKAVKLLLPLAARLNEVNRTMLLPALADGQTGVALDAKLQSKQFIKQLPATKKAMPMIEPALVLGVSNAELLRKAMGEYREIINAAAVALREIDPNVPAFVLPEPKVAKTAAGTLYTYPLPDEWGVTKEVSLCMGLSEKVAAVASSEKHAQRLLVSTPLSAGGLLADTNRPLAGAWMLDWAGLIDAATPWIELAAEEIIKQQLPAAVKAEKAEAPAAKAEKDGDKPEPKKPAKKKGGAKQPGAKKAAPKKDAQKAEIMAQVHTVLKVLKTLRMCTSEIYPEDGAMVSHMLIEIRDIE